MKKITITLPRDVVVLDGDGQLNHQEYLKQLRIIKQQLEDEWKFYQDHGHRWPEDKRDFTIEGDRGLIINSRPGCHGPNIYWEHDRIVEAISHTEQMIATETAERPKRRGPELDDESTKILNILRNDPTSKATQITGTLYPTFSGDRLNREVTRIQRKSTYLKKRLQETPNQR